jgi:hypothetical protein
MIPMIRITVRKSEMRSFIHIYFLKTENNFIGGLLGDLILIPVLNPGL